MKPVLQLTRKLIEISSTAENPSDLTKVLQVAGQEVVKFHKQEFTSGGKPSVLYSNRPHIKKFKIILNAHLDVVPGKSEQYKPEVKNSRLYGRGACDMKSGAAAEILAFATVADKVSYPLGLQLVTDEEIGGFHGTKYQIGQGVKADFVIAGESTDLKLNNLAKGVFWLKITAPGAPAHAAYLWQGKNAVWRMHQFLTTLGKTFPVPLKESWITTANLAKIETSNTTFNKVPPDCTISLDIRYIPEEAAVIEKKIRSLAPKDFQVEVVVKEPSQKTDKSNPYLKLLAGSISHRTGSSAKFIAKHGASDIRHYDGVSIPGVCFGPAGDGLHSDNEWGDIASFEKYYHILIDFLKSVQ